MDKHFSPTLTVLGWGAVANVVAPDYHDSHVWAFPQKRWQCAHEDMVASVWLQIAIDKGNDFVGFVHLELAVQCEIDLAVGCDRFGVNAVMDHGYFVAKRERKSTGLPVSR